MPAITLRMSFSQVQWSPVTMAFGCTTDLLPRLLFSLAQQQMRIVQGKCGSFFVHEAGLCCWRAELWLKAKGLKLETREKKKNINSVVLPRYFWPVLLWPCAFEQSEFWTFNYDCAMDCKTSRVQCSTQRAAWLRQERFLRKWNTYKCLPKIFWFWSCTQVLM